MHFEFNPNSVIPNESFIILEENSVNFVNDKLTTKLVIHVIDHCNFQNTSGYM